ncbi:hypothetical protein EVJ58_g201 [Rhodofomes roseus]|uniref:Uncharacterized protein n=1 Tax=Rhodofomes roseus TaxID=34475 RepID=A0A4Y9Z7P7_9APHY|nr:hypothetical protein EVJ58_g201 [Rhodofomes roseus]
MVPYNRQQGDDGVTHARCTWDGGICGITLDDLTPSGVIRHLKAFHFNNPLNAWENKKRGVCRWGHDCSGCEMNYESLGKHIASVHLRSTARPVHSLRAAVREDGYPQSTPVGELSRRMSAFGLATDADTQLYA